MLYSPDQSNKIQQKFHCAQTTKILLGGDFLRSAIMQTPQISNSNTKEVKGNGLFAEIDEKQINESSQPQFAINAPAIMQNCFKIRVAIDFGTDGIGICYIIYYILFIAYVYMAQQLYNIFSISICIWRNKSSSSTCSMVII